MNCLKSYQRGILNEKIDFHSLHHSKCLDLTLENEILQVITVTKAYQITENQLTLLDENGAVLMLFQAVD